MVLFLLQINNTVLLLDNGHPRIHHKFPSDICFLLVYQLDIDSRILQLQIKYNFSDGKILTVFRVSILHERIINTNSISNYFKLGNFYKLKKNVGVRWILSETNLIVLQRCLFFISSRVTLYSRLNVVQKFQPATI